MKRAIARLDLPDITSGIPATPKPEITWIAPGELLVDESYQRDLSPASLVLIRKIVEGWDWRRLKPPIAAWTDEGLEVIDGQHTAIAAVTHGGIAEIPVVVVEAMARTDRAQAFLGHNRDRLGITGPQMHHAALAAGDEMALKVARVCAAAEVVTLRIPPAGGAYKPRTTIAVAAVRTLAAAIPEADAAWVLRTLADGGIAPITAYQIRALQHLITEKEFAKVDREALASAVAAIPIKVAEREAKEHAATHQVTVWRGLAAAWFKAAHKFVKRSGTRPEEALRVPATGGPVSIPAWVPDDLVEDFCNIAAAEGEEVAVAHVRQFEAQRDTTIGRRATR